MAKRPFQIGDHVTLRDLQGVSREGRIVSSENVAQRDQLGRREGRWVTLRIRGSLFEDVSVHESALGGILAVTQ